MLNGLLAI
uniref:Nucleic acid binding protein n=1 Tax=Arundo donax TaxID=35708 RepID=A0A0A9AH15_ARUDO